MSSSPSATSTRNAATSQASSAGWTNAVVARAPSSREPTITSRPIAAEASASTAAPAGCSAQGSAIPANCDPCPGNSTADAMAGKPSGPGSRAGPVTGTWFRLDEVAALDGVWLDDPAKPMAERVQRSSSPRPRSQGTEGVLGFLGRDMAVDLGTANTLVYVRGRGVVLNEPSVVAINTLTGAILAVGAEAKRMIGRTPSHIQAVRPLKDGVIADFDVTEKMLRYFIQRVHKRRLLAKPRVVVCVPSGITGVEQRAVEEATIAAGSRRAYIIEEPMAAAIGAGLPIHEPTGNMIVDIGGGTTEVAVISLGGIVTSTSIRIGGDELDEAIIQHVKKEYSLLLGERTAEAIKLAIASVFPMPDELVAEIKGRDLVCGLPKTITISAEEIRRAIEEPVNAIIDAIKTTLDRTPPELAADIMDRGIVLTGGGALLRGLDKRLRHETGMPVRISDMPLQAVVLGSGKCLEEFEVLQRVLVSPSSRR